MHPSRRLFASGDRHGFNAAVRVLALGWLLVILALTLRPDSGPGTAAGSAPLADVVRNVVLFAPLGWLAGLSGQRIRDAAILGALLSAMIEALQIWIPGRDASARDLAANTVGMAVAAELGRTMVGPIVRSAARAGRLAAAAGVCGVAVMLLPGLLFCPAPPASLYYTEWAPDFPPYALFSGRVLEASIDGLPIEPSGPSRNSAALRERLLGRSAISLRAIAGAHQAGLAPVVRINDGRREVLFVGVQGDDLVIRRHTLAGELGLEEPLFRAPGAIAAARDGRPFQVAIEPIGAGWRARVGSAPETRIGPTPGSAWRFVADSDALPDGLRRGLDALSLALVFAAIGIWFRPRVPAIAGLAAAVAALVFAPQLTGVGASPPGEWAGAAIGLMAGVGVQRSIRALAAAVPLGADAQGLRE